MNKSGTLIATATIAGLLLGSRAAHATLIPSEPVRLATRDKSAIALLACDRPLTKSDELEAIRLLDTQQIYVDVTCEPFGHIRGFPALKIASCDNITGHWACSTEGAVRLQLAGREVVLSYDSRIDFEAVLEIAEYAASVRSFNGHDVAAYIGGRCYVSDGKSVPFEGAVSFNFGCDGWVGAITKDCGGGNCRLYFTQFSEFIV